MKRVHLALILTVPILAIVACAMESMGHPYWSTACLVTICVLTFLDAAFVRRSTLYLLDELESRIDDD